jgi:hypothetical protein
MPRKNVRKEIVEIWTDPARDRDDIDRFMRTFRTLRRKIYAENPTLHAKLLDAVMQECRTSV